MNDSIISVTGPVADWQVLINLLDVAVKSAGIPAAKAVVVWTERIQKEVAASQATKQTEAVE